MLLKIFVFIFFVLTTISAQWYRPTSIKCGFKDWQCNDGSCLPQSSVCDGVPHCSDRSDEGPFMCARRRCPDSFSCDGSCIDRSLVCDGKKNCADGADESDQVCRSCLPTPFIDEGLVQIDVGATIDKRKSKKNKGFEFKIRCNPGYSLGRGNLRCINGTWTGITPACIKCGTVTPGSRRTTAEGDSYQYGAAPWHVGVYSKLKRPYKLVCGGSLISAKFVLSAAQCFWDDAVGVLPAPIFAVAAGKVFSAWDDDRDYYSQSSDVDDIKVPELFLGETNNLTYNVAVVTLASPFQFTKYVRPVCIDYSGSETRWIDQEDTVTVWRPSSRNRSTQIASTLKVERCKTEPIRDFRNYKISEKICATYSGATIGAEVAGSGLINSRESFGETIYFLQYIASAGKDQPISPRPSLIFTKLEKYRSLITKYYE